MSRKQILNDLVTELKKIDGEVSTFDPDYAYKTNLNNNAFRGFKFLDEVNDFPSIYFQPGSENRVYQSAGFVNAELELTIRSYGKQEDVAEQLEDLFLDIEHVLNNVCGTIDNVQDIQILSIDTTDSLFDPLGIGETIINIFYDLE